MTEWGQAADLFKPCAFCGHDPRTVTLDSMLWGRIVLRVNEGADPGLIALVDQAIMGPSRAATEETQP